MKTIHAIYDNGVFRPLEPVALADQCEVELEPKVVQPPKAQREAMKQVFRILSRSFPTGQPDLAARQS
jgi:predicted DNA-binding antitoxin AbrB/MazE fold protein